MPYVKKILFCYLAFLNNDYFAHKHLSPNNILVKIVNDEEVIKLCDYGLESFSNFQGETS